MLSFMLWDELYGNINAVLKQLLCDPDCARLLALRGWVGGGKQTLEKGENSNTGNVTKAAATFLCINSRPSTLVLLFARRHPGTEGEK